MRGWKLSKPNATKSLATTAKKVVEALVASFGARKMRRLNHVFDNIGFV